MKHAVTQDLYAYWQQLRGRRLAPDRVEIEPGDIRHLLCDTFILEVAVDSEDYRYRLAGTRVCAAYGRELKGRNILSQWTGKDRETIATLLSAVASEAAAAVIGLEAKSSHGRSMAGEMLFLPVRQGGQGYTRILGSFITMEQPYWIGVHPLMTQSVTSLRMIWPSERPALRQVDEIDDEIASVPVLSRPSLHSRVLAGQTEARRVGHLVVLEGGKAES